MDILIIGGGPAGIAAAMSARTFSPTKRIAIVNGSKRPSIPCGIPYTMRTILPEQNLYDYEALEALGIELIQDDALLIHPLEHHVDLANRRISYDKLILATGSKPNRLTCPGADLDTVHYIYKDTAHLARLREHALCARNIVIIGGGYIGVEFAWELSEHAHITILERNGHVLSHSYDHAMTRLLHKRFADRGVRIHPNSTVQSIEKHGDTTHVITDHETISCDLVIVGIGASPNIDLAINSNLHLTDTSISVDDYQRTPHQDIFAVGDCAQKKDFITGKSCKILLATAAVLEGRIAGANLYERILPRIHSGIIATSSTSLTGIAMASAGITQEDCLLEHIDHTAITVTRPQKHPCSLPGGEETMQVKLIFDAQTRIIGCQAVGSNEHAIEEIVNIANIVIQNRIGINEIITTQFSSHPHLAGLPSAHPFIDAALEAYHTIR